MLRRKPEEVLGMFSEALKILDQNTIKYMIEMQQKELEEKEARLRERDAVISEKDTAISQRDIMIEAQKEEIVNLRKQLESQLKMAKTAKKGMATKICNFFQSVPLGTTTSWIVTIHGTSGTE